MSLPPLECEGISNSPTKYKSVLTSLIKIDLLILFLFFLLTSQISTIFNVFLAGLKAQRLCIAKPKRFSIILLFYSFIQIHLPSELFLSSKRFRFSYSFSDCSLDVSLSRFVFAHIFSQKLYF